VSPANESGGLIELVSDRSNPRRASFLAREEGIFVEPGIGCRGCGSCWPSSNAGEIDSGLQIADHRAGHGLKDVDTACLATWSDSCRGRDSRLARHLIGLWAGGLSVTGAINPKEETMRADLAQQRVLGPGRSVTVEVPATSANLGPGFDCFGLALDWRERVNLAVIEDGYRIEVSGEGAAELPRDESHLIIRAVLVGLG
jgi:hypothetical protein